MPDAGQGGDSGEIVWPARLKRTPVRVLWFDRIRSLPPGLDLQTIANMFEVGKTTAHMWVNTFGYVTRDDRGGRGKKRKSPSPQTPTTPENPPAPGAPGHPFVPPEAMERVGSFDAVAEDGSRHVILIFRPGVSDQPATRQPVLFTSFNERVYRVSTGIYQFVATGKRLISKDPKAP
jgi:hypothetical protein